MKFDRLMNSIPEYGLDETRMLTKVAPGRYKMVTKTKAGKVGDYEMNFTEHGIYETASVGGLTATCFYRCLFYNSFNSQYNYKTKVAGNLSMRNHNNFSQTNKVKF